MKQIMQTSILRLVFSVIICCFAALSAQAQAKAIASQPKPVSAQQVTADRQTAPGQAIAAEQIVGETAVSAEELVGTIPAAKTNLRKADIERMAAAERAHVKSHPELFNIIE